MTKHLVQMTFSSLLQNHTQDVQDLMVMCQEKEWELVSASTVHEMSGWVTFTYWKLPAN